MVITQSDCLSRFGWDDFDHNRLENRSWKKKSSQCPVKGCSATLLWIPYGDRRNRDRTKPWCPEHGIRLHSDTFVYWNGPDQNDEARLRNFIVDHDLARAIALPKGMKAEAHRLGFEMSEDALSWNVFRSLAVADKLREAAEFLTGRSLRKTPHLYLWGRRVDDSDGDHGLYEPLRRVRRKLESRIHSFPTEPDIMLVAEGELLVCVEAKFGSGNSLAYDSTPLEGKKPTSRADLLAFYLGDRTSKRTRLIISPDKIGPALRSQLLRNIVFASEMTDGTPWHVVNLVSSTQWHRRRDSRYYSYADPTSEVCGYLQDEWRHCFTFLTWEGFHTAVISSSPELALLDQYLRSKSARFRRAFALATELSPRALG
jgi:hypothetical protein